MARILLGVSGGIAAYKALEFARLATVAGHGVRVLMTENATRFVGAASFEGIVGAPVLISEFERDPMRGAVPRRPAARARPDRPPRAGRQLRRLSWSRRPRPTRSPSSPAGAADSMLTTSFLACAAPRLVAPAMNDRMYADAATQANLATLRERGRDVVEPEEGALASPGRAGSRAASRPGPAAGPGRSGAADRRAALGRDAGARHRRRHPRAGRPGPLPRQPLERPDGDRPRRRRCAPRGRGDPDRRQRLAARAGRGAPDRRRDHRRARRGRPAAEFAGYPRPGDGRGAGRLPRRPSRRPTS